MVNTQKLLEEANQSIIEGAQTIEDLKLKINDQ